MTKNFFSFLKHFVLPKNKSLPFRGIRLLLALVLVCSVLYYCNQKREFSLSSSTGAQSTIRQASLLPTAPPTFEPYLQLISYIVKPGDTFAGILAKFNIPEHLASYYYSSLKSIGLSSLFPGDSLVLVKDNPDRLKTFSILSRLSFWYSLRQDDSTLQIEKKPVEVTTYHSVVKGTLESSLSYDMYLLDVSDALVIKLADIFAWDINFFVDPKKGDTFEVLFEKLYREGRFIGYGNILAAKYVNSGKAFYALGLPDTNGVLQYYDINGKSVQKEFLKAPLRFRRISSGFSYSRKHPVLGIRRPHFGVDYAAAVGTPVYASADGTIASAGFNGDYGKQICVRHGASYQSFYGHLHSIQPGISPGVRVRQGQMIGTVGSTGMATGPHLDYRMTIGSRYVNPLTISLPSKQGVSLQEQEKFVTLKQYYCTLLETRVQNNGCFIVDIIPSQPQEPIASKTSPLPVSTHDNAPGS